MKHLALRSFYMIPFVVLLWFVASFSVNVPVHDQWRLVSLFEKLAGGTATCGDFWALHGSHRIVFPKMLMSALAFCSQWNISLELVASILFAIMTFLMLHRLSATQARNPKDRLFHLTNVLTAVFVFSLVQHENWLWGFQLAWFLVNLCVVAAIFLLCANDTQGASGAAKLFAAAICCEVASFSSAHGLLSWLALFPAVIAMKGTAFDAACRLALWTFLSGVTAAFYAFDYHPHRDIDIGSLAKQPMVVAHYFLNVLGSPLVDSPVFSGLVGLGIFSLFMFFFLSFGRHFFSHRETAPWLSLGSFSLLAAASITVGRAHFGVNHAIDSSRYTTIAILLYVAVIQLWLALLRIDRRQARWVSRPGIYEGFAAMIVAALALTSAQAVVHAKTALPHRKSAKTSLEIIYYLDGAFFDDSPDSCLWVMTKKTAVIRQGAEALDRIGFRKIATDIPFVDRPGAVYGRLDTPPATGTLSVRRSELLQFAGWAILPHSHEQPHLVLLSHGNNHTVFASACVDGDSPDLAETLGSWRYRQRRWGVALPARFLPIGETNVFAWIYDADERQFVRLQGDARVNVHEEACTHHDRP
jgi:hypothetical protein